MLISLKGKKKLKKKKEKKKEEAINQKILKFTAKK